MAAWRELFDAACANWRLEEARQLLRIPKQMSLSPMQLAEVYHGEGVLQAQLGDWKQSVAALTKAIDLLEDTPNVRFGVIVLNDLGMVLRLQGRNEAAELIHKQALELSEVIGATDLAAEALGHLALDLEHRGDIEAAIPYFEEALTKFEALGAEEEVARIHNHLGEAKWRVGALDSAMQHLRQAAELLGEPPRNRHLFAQIAGNMGAVHYERGDLEAAETYWRAAIETVEALGAVFDKAGLLNNLGGLAYSRKDYQRAYVYFRESLTLAQDLGDKRGVAEAKHNLALLARKGIEVRPEE